MSSDDLSQPRKPSEQHAGVRESSAEALNMNATSAVNGESTAQDTPPTSVTAVFDPRLPPTVRRRRVADACFLCRRRKIRCDAAHPKCGNCVRIDRICEYQPPKNEFQPMGMTEKLDSLQDDMNKLLHMLPQLTVQRKNRAMPFSLEDCLGPQQEIEVTAEQRRMVQSLEDSLLKLSTFPNWEPLSTRLIRYKLSKP
jgi:Fungal Zn(2)-Cys(6) binuclear cluster domain